MRRIQKKQEQRLDHGSGQLPCYLRNCEGFIGKLHFKKDQERSRMSDGTKDESMDKNSEMRNRSVIEMIQNLNGCNYLDYF